MKLYIINFYKSLQRIAINILDFIVAAINMFTHWLAKHRADMYASADNCRYYVIPDRSKLFHCYQIRSTKDLSEHNRKAGKNKKADINEVLRFKSYMTK